MRPCRDDILASVQGIAPVAPSRVGQGLRVTLRWRSGHASGQALPWFSGANTRMHNAKLPHRREVRHLSRQAEIRSGLTEICANPLFFLLVALAMRLAVAVYLPPPDDFMYLMEPGRTAANLVTGQGYAFDFYGTRPDSPLEAFLPPLHPWFIALALQFSHPALACALTQAILGTVTVWLLYRLATGLAVSASRCFGLLVAWGSALYPPHLLLVGQPHSTVLHACCLIAALLAYWWVYKQHTVRHALVAGGLTGIFALGRPQVVAFVPIVAGWLWLNRVPGRQLWRLTAALLFGATVVVLPWCVRNTLLFGRPTFISTNGGVTFWNGNNPFTTGSAHDVYADRLAAYRGLEPDPSLPQVYQHPEPYPFPPEIEERLETISELELDRASYQAGLKYILQQPANWLKLERQKLVSFWWFRPNLGANPLYQETWTAFYRVQYTPLLALTIAGIVLSVRHWRRYTLLYAVLVFYTLVHVAFNVLTRYRWEIELLMLIFAALALETVGKRILGWKRVA
jgi:hypothetical protein